MGHTRLGKLPKTYSWKQVIYLLEEDGDVSDIADASLAAAKEGLKRVPEDPGFAQILTNIFRFVESARSGDFDEALAQNGFSPPKEDSVFDLIAILREKNDYDLYEQRIKSDVSEIAQNSFSETIFQQFLTESRSLFESSIEDTRNSLRKQLTGNRFKVLMHEFYSTFTRRYLTYYLSRELPNFVIPNGRFRNIKEHDEFNEAFNLYIRQTIRITDEFTPGWLNKAHFEGRLSRENISKYAHVAFEKIRSEFERGG